MSKAIWIIAVCIACVTSAQAGQLAKQSTPLTPRPKAAKAKPMATPVLPTPRQVRRASVGLSSPLRPAKTLMASWVASLSSPLSPPARTIGRSTLGLSSPLLPSARIARKSQATQLPTTKPVLAIEPADTTLTLDAKGFAAARIRFKNKGVGKLTISRITPSCGCASASVQRNTIDSTGTGMFVIGVNGKNVSDTLDVVEWIVESNATVPAYAYRVRVKRSKE